MEGGKIGANLIHRHRLSSHTPLVRKRQGATFQKKRELSHWWVKGHQLLNNSANEIRVMALIEPEVILCEVRLQCCCRSKRPGLRKPVKRRQRSRSGNDGMRIRAANLRECNPNADGERRGIPGRSGPSPIATALSREEVKATHWLHRTGNGPGFYCTPIYQVKYFLLFHSFLC